MRSYIDRALEAHPKLSPVVEKLIEPATRLDVTLAADVPLGASRIGGVPDMPASVKWPELSGSPFQFVAQIRLNEIAPRPDGLPASGTLWFFVHWRDPDKPEARVLFHDNPEPLIRRATPDDHATPQYLSPRPPDYPMCRVSFSPTVTLPGPWRAHPNPRYTMVGGALTALPSFEAYKQFWWEMMGLISSADDPDLGVGQLLGAFPDDGDDAQILVTPEERLLLWVRRTPASLGPDDSDDGAWGDEQEDLYFVVPSAALLARYFDAVRVLPYLTLA